MQSKTDSLMEALVNILIGLVVSTIANHWVLPSILNVQMSLGQNVLIGAIFTLISLVRSYVLRRLFNGRSVWVALKEARMFSSFSLRRKPKAAAAPLKPSRTRSAAPASTYSPSTSTYDPSPASSYDPFPTYLAAASFSSSYDSSPSYSSSDSSSSFSSGGGDFGGGGSSGDW